MSLFSVKNQGIYKIVTILGIKLRFVRHRRVEQLFSMGINKEKIASEIENYKKCGVNKNNDRSPRLIVSLTSYPARMYDIHYCLYSLLTQTIKPDEVVLWLANEQFPNKEEDVPIKVLNLKKNGLTIKWCKDYKSYKKLIPALKTYPNDIIVTADDDIFYATDWLEKLYNEYLKGDKKTIYAHRAHKVSYKNRQILPYKKWKKSISDESVTFYNFATGAGGILYPPKCLYEDIIDDQKFMSLCPKADDVWFWTMALLNSTKIKVIKNPNNLVYVNPTRELGLNDDGNLIDENKRGGNDMQLGNVIKQYPALLKTLETK